MARKKLPASTSRRDARLMRRFAEDFIAHPYYYHDYNRTIWEIADRLRCTRRAVKSLLMGKPIPGLYLELSAQECRGRWLPVYRLYVYDWKRTRSYLQGVIDA